MSELIVLTCASGKQCSHVIPHLYDSYKLRLVVHSEKSAERLTKQYPNAQVVAANLENPIECHKLLSGATAIYHVNPSFHPLEREIGINMVNAAVAEAQTPDSKFKHFVLSSVLSTQFSKMLNHDRKKWVEEYLMESPLNWTILQPGHFADPPVGRLMQVASDAYPTFQTMFDPSVMFSFLVLRDMGEVSGKVIKEREKHYFATYPLSSTMPMPYTAFVQTVGKAFGKEFKIEQLEFYKAVDLCCVSLFGTKDVDQRVRDGPERMLLFYNKRGLIGNPSVMKWLLGREPTSIEQLAKLHSQAAQYVKKGAH